MSIEQGAALAIDIGGTFTDVVLKNGVGETWSEKVLTTPHDLLQAFFDGVDSVLRQADIAPDQVDDIVVHATTLVTNCVIERKGLPTALFTTAGFRDVLYIRDESRTNIFDNQQDAIAPLIPRELTFGLLERVRADGSVQTPISDQEIGDALDAAVAGGARSVAVCFLNAFANGANERRVLAVARKRHPRLYVTLSVDVAPQVREYLRTSTAAINAYTMPIVADYLSKLAAGVERHGFRQKPLIMLSSGGVVGVEAAAARPVRMIESGPAAGALAATYFSARLDCPRLLGFDMGGTTAKACFIENGAPLITNLFEVDRQYRFEQGSGMPILTSCIDLIEIGSGGGSIAHRDELGLLAVGPESAGSEPGPACYGRGGEAATVTDANVVLGMLSPHTFLGGDMTLDRAAADRAIKKLGEALDLTPERAALGIYMTVAELMAAAVRSHAAERGFDWRGFSILAFGGAGPVHACQVADLLGAAEVIFPPLASTLSAFGTLVSPVSLDLARSSAQRLERIDWQAVGAFCDEMVIEAQDTLLAAGCEKSQITFSYAADLRYLGQQHELSVQLEPETIRRRDAGAIRRAFEKVYTSTYGLELAGHEVEAVTWRVRGAGPERRGSTIKVSRQPQRSSAMTRPVHFADGVHETPVHVRMGLTAGETYQGPAIIEERDTTIVVLPRWEFMVDPIGCLVARRNVGAPSTQEQADPVHA